MTTERHISPQMYAI